MLERAAAYRYIFAPEFGSAGIGIFEDTILNSQIVAGELDSAVLRPIGGISKTNAF
jgi:hypothetical protein